MAAELAKAALAEAQGVQVSGSELEALMVLCGLSTAQVAREISLSPRRLREIFRFDRPRPSDVVKVTAGILRLAEGAEIAS